MLDSRGGFARLGFFEDAKGGGVLDEPPDDFFGEVGVFCDVGVGGGAI